jgi:hypothetical protein
MTRLKYKTFKGDGHQDVDDWFSEFESTAVANQEEGRSVEVVPRHSGSGPERLGTTHHDFLTSVPGSWRRSKSAGTAQQDDHEDIRIRTEVWTTGKGSYLEVNYGDRP